MLPCHHDQRIVAQVRPTIDLLTQLDTLHPDVLLQHSIEPSDYKSGLVFRSAIESIRGRFAALSTTGRQGLVASVLEELYRRSAIAGYELSSSSNRYDFTVSIERNPDYFAALEVKGGEGNSINISDRPLWAREFGVWSHLDGAIVNQPAHGAHSIVNCITNELVKRGKLVDVLFFKDILCGTSLRPCPKYPLEKQQNNSIAPDIFLFPQRVPTIDDPEPPVHTLDTLKLPRLMLDLFDVSPTIRDRHLWFVSVKIIKQQEGKFLRIVEVQHEGKTIDSSVSRPWRL